SCRISANACWACRNRIETRGLGARASRPRAGRKEAHMVQRVAIAGFGAIGRVVAEALDRGIDGLALASVSARDTARAERAMAGLAHPVPVVPLARLADAADIVVECAPA